MMILLVVVVYGPLLDYMYKLFPSFSLSLMAIKAPVHRHRNVVPVI